MGTNKHVRDRVASDRITPPAGQDRLGDNTHALRAGKNGPTQRKSSVSREAPNRDRGSDDRRSGSESGKS